MSGYRVKAGLLDGLVFGYLAMVLMSTLSAMLSLKTLNESWAQANMGTASAIFAGLCVAGAGLSYFLNRITCYTLGESLFAPAHLKVEITARGFWRSLWGWQLFISFMVILVTGLEKTGFSFSELTDPDGFEGAIRLFGGLLSPNFDILPQAILKIIETIYIAFIATVFAIPLAFVLSFLCAKNIMSHPVAFAIYGTLRTLLNIMRSVEPLIWAIIFSVWVGIGPFAGMLALMIHSVASLAKQYSEIVESAHEGPIEGIESTGAHFLQVIWFAIVPQVLLPYIAFTIYRWDINVRMATIIGLVGGGGIGTMLIKYQGQALWQEVGCIIFVIAVVVWLMDTASAYIREAIK